MHATWCMQHSMHATPSHWQQIEKIWGSPWDSHLVNTAGGASWGKWRWHNQSSAEHEDCCSHLKLSSSHWFHHWTACILLHSCYLQLQQCKSIVHLFKCVSEQHCTADNCIMYLLRTIFTAIVRQGCPSNSISCLWASIVGDLAVNFSFPLNTWP